ncbi:hypothetical protein B0H16DRAFT_1451241 [Mycena metata]|uniref:Uncharacterized protein n=1 Tax=Mycena metata TaxID=1033252 RepID=A0AAD7JWT4_9AGAR|nr:hypothetical protein B0H16DRAFT_1451241 [Mycena metata]
MWSMGRHKCRPKRCLRLLEAIHRRVGILQVFFEHKILPVPLEIAEGPCAESGMPGGVLKGFWKGSCSLRRVLDEERVLNVILEDGRGLPRKRDGVAYTGTAVRSTSRMVGERDKSININITRFNNQLGRRGRSATDL